MNSGSNLRKIKSQNRQASKRVVCSGCCKIMKATVSMKEKLMSGEKCYCVECRGFGLVSLSKCLARIV